MTTPLILASTPVDGAVDVLIDSVIIFQFNTALDSTTLHEGTFALWDDSTLEPIPISVVYNSSTYKVNLIPRQAMRELHTYRASVFGVDNGAAQWVKSSGGDPLSTTYTTTFRTAQDQYVPLDEVTDLDDVERVGPIRAVAATAPPGTVSTATTTTFEIVESVPVGFKTEVPVCTTGITIELDIPASGLDAYATLEVYPALGIEEYYAAADGTGTVWLNDSCAPTGNYTLAGLTGNYLVSPPVFTQPVGSFSTSGNYLIWTADVDDPCFNYNTEVHVVIPKEGRPVSNAGLTGINTLDIETVFTTKYFPKFIDHRMLRVELGAVLANMYDDTINRIIHKNSIDAWEQAAGNFNIDEPHPAVRRYVKACSIIDIVDALTLQTGVLNGNERKQLGDFVYDRGGLGGNSINASHPVYRRALEDKQRWLTELRKYRGQNKPLVAVKGANAYSTPADERSRTWDNWMIYTLNGLLVGDLNKPSANMRQQRRHTIEAATDHGGFRLAYGSSGTANASVFKCRSRT